MSNLLNTEQLKYLDQFNKQENPLLLKMEHFARLNNIPILERSSAQFLEQLIRISKPKQYLEIGMAIAYSTIRVAKILKNECKIDTIEKSKDNIKLANTFINESEVGEYIRILEGEALEIMNNLSTYDFIFLDADKEDYLDLLNASIPLLNDGGLILVDNLLWKGFTASSTVDGKYKKSTELIREFNAKFINHPKLNSAILPIGDGLGLGIKVLD